MRLIIMAALACAALFCNAQQTNYTKAWQALNKSNRSEAETLLDAAIKDNTSFEDAYLTKLYLLTFSGREHEMEDFDKKFYPASKNPFPYIYALWFNTAITGTYSKKEHDYQVNILDHIIADPKAPGELIAAANYQKGMHYLFSNNFSKAQKAYDEIGNVKNWQYTGPFENLSESGFNKDYGPLKHPEASATFKSMNNADIAWMIPGGEIKDGWNPVNYIFQKNTAVVFAQNFITVPSDRTILCNAGATGSIKVWINDQPVISESRERVTELDAYSVKCTLKKGVNRILVQLGYSATNYPNFSIRLTDENHLPVKDLTASPVYTAYAAADASQKPEAVAQFAETFFKEKIKAQPENLINYMLLSDVYMRNKKTEEAKALLDKAIAQAPENSLLGMKRIEILIKENDRTTLLEEVANIRKEDPESLIIMELDLKEMFQNEKYEDAAELLQKRINKYGEDETTIGYKISLLGRDKKYEEIVKVVEKAYEKYPTNTNLLGYMYSIKKDVKNDNKGAVRMYEDYRKNIFNYSVEETYSKLLADGGSSEKALKIKLALAENFPYDPEMFYKISGDYFVIKQYTKAEENIRKALAIAPYYSDYWEQLGDIKSEMGNKPEALNAYSKSLEYDPKQFTIIAKTRKLRGQEEILKLLPENDTDKIIKEDKPADAQNTDYGFYYILDRKDVIMHQSGATEEFITLAIRITNDKGVERFKETTLPYNNSQTLLIEKAEIIKKNQNRLQGERNDNEVVFTNLQVNDIVVFKYRLQNYTYGRFAKDYWDKFIFGGQIYSGVTHYNLLMPAEKKIFYEFSNSSVKPAVTDAENFKLYSWDILKSDAMKDEPFMPTLTDAGTVLHITTVPSWNDISGWYSDVINNRAEENSEVTRVFNKLFAEGVKKLSEKERAVIIYDYIEKNIKYSSVSFRQSAYVPQKASTTLITRLGDCKDLSNLFVMMADMAGIKAQMVLIDTKDNGVKDMILPSVEFNHCIVKAVLDKKEYYIELTDNYLPMGSLPKNDLGALILEIPGKNMSASPSIKFLKADNKTKDVIRRTMDITPSGSDLIIKVKVVKKGASSADTRYTYRMLDPEKTKEEMEKTVAGAYRNNVSLTDVSFTDLDKLNDSVQYTYAYKVKNEITEIGSMQTFKVTYPDVVASLDNFSKDARSFPLQYWKYEDQDGYETIINFTAPAGKKIIELPANETLTFQNMQYTIEYTLKGFDKLTIKRNFKSEREIIAAKDYPAFKAFFEKIVRAEQKFIAFK